MEENIKEVIVLSDLIRRQEFRACFLKHFTKKVKELEGISSKIDEKILQRLQLALLEPLMFHLINTSNSMDKCAVVEGIIQVLKLTQIHLVSVFFDVYTRVFFQIFQEGNLPYQPSEELKHCVLECCRVLIKNSTQNVLEKVYTEESGGKFSLGISVSVDIVKQEKSIKLRISALDFLLIASQFVPEAKDKKEIFNKVGDLFMLYLPGILAPLLEVILRDETQHHLITAKALCCWGHVLCVVMRDSVQKESLSDIEIMKQWLVDQKQKQNEIIDVNTALKEKKRSKHWLESAAIVLHPFVVRLSDVRKHSHPECRLELTQVMVKILKNCKRNLKNCLPIVIEILVSSVEDENAEVQQVAERALEEFEAECNENNVEFFAPVIEENLYLVIKKLPGIVHSGQEQLILSLLKSLSGYLRILGRLNRLHHLLSLSSTLRKLILVIRTSFELEVYPELRDQDFSIWENETNPKIWSRPWKRFRFFTDRSIKTQLEGTCRDIGKYGPSETIFDFLLDAHKEEHNLFKKEILLILNEIILGSKEIKDHVVHQLLDFYLDPQNLYLALQVNDVECTNLKEAQTNIIRVALIMEGIGKLAKRIGKRFQDYLLKSLYYVLERMGSSYWVIREAAVKSATEIANACGLEGSVKCLIQNNIDYLSYHLTIKLKRNEESVFDVVTVLMKNSPFESLPNLEEIINRVLKSSSQNYDSPHTFSYLRLFQTFVLCARKWLKKNYTQPSSSNKEFEETYLSQLIKFVESVTEKEKEQKDEDDVCDDETDIDYIPEEPKKPELPRHLKLTLAIANHCLHHLPSKDNNKKIVVLEILNECVWALADWEDDLLPLVHNIWSPLVTRFEGITDPLIINRSFTLLCTLSFTSKDFIRRRTLKNVMPVLTSFLAKQAAKSKLKDSASGYFFSQNFKLQRELLGNLGKLTSSLMLFERETDLVVESALPYLSSLQPQELQEKCRTLFTDLIAHDKYLVWFKVQNLFDDPEFTKNAEIILNSMK